MHKKIWHENYTKGILHQFDRSTAKEIPDHLNFPKNGNRRVFKGLYERFNAARKNGQSDELQKDLEDLFNKHSTAASPDKTEITAVYLKGTVQC